MFPNVHFSAWVLEDMIWPFVQFKSRFTLTQRIPRGFKEAVEATEDVIKAMPQVCKPIYILLHIGFFSAEEDTLVESFINTFNCYPKDIPRDYLIFKI